MFPTHGRKKKSPNKPFPNPFLRVYFQTPYSDIRHEFREQSAKFPHLPFLPKEQEGKGNVLLLITSATEAACSPNTFNLAVM